MRTLGRGSLAVLALLLGLLFVRPALAEWRQDSFLIGGFGIGQSWDPNRLVLLNDAGLDVLVNNDRWGTSDAIQFRFELDSLRQHHAAFAARGIIMAAEVPLQRHARCETCWAGDSVCHRGYDLYHNTFPDSAAVRDSVRMQLGPSRGLNSSSILGWYIWDEPVASCHLNRAFFMDSVIAGFDSSRTQLPFVNLDPSYVSDLAEPPVRRAYRAQFGVNKLQAFQTYLKSWLARFDELPSPAPVLSVDHYAFINPKATLTDFLFTLRTVRDAAAKYSRPGHAIPVWTIVQLASGRTGGDATPTESQTRFQAYAALAYGAKAIFYWTVVPEFGAWGDGLLTSSGAKSAKYAATQRLNSEMHHVGAVLFDCDPLWSFQRDTLDQVGIADERVGIGSDRHQLVAAINGAADAGSHCLIGQFRSRINRQDVLLVVNRDTSAAHSYTVTLDAVVNAIDRLDKKTGQWSRTTAHASSFTSPSIEPGGGELFRLDR